MSTSVFENILARVATVLNNATDAGVRVYRGRVDAFADEESPSLNIRRASTTEDAVAQNAGREVLVFEIEHRIDGTDDWETAVDAFHMQTHALLAADAQLPTLGKGLRCVGTDIEADNADRIVGKLTARYQIQVFVRPGDFTRSIN